MSTEGPAHLHYRVVHRAPGPFKSIIQFAVNAFLAVEGETQPVDFGKVEVHTIEEPYVILVTGASDLEEITHDLNNMTVEEFEEYWL